MDWIVTHCGHPTALYPYLIHIRGEDPVLAPNGMAWQLKKDAEAAARLIESGQLSTYRNKRGNRCAGKGSKHSQILAVLHLIGSRLVGTPTN